MQGAQILSLVRELDPTWRNKSPHAATKIPLATAKIRHANLKKKKKSFPLGDIENRLMVTKGEAAKGRNGNCRLAEASCYVQNG